MSSRKYNSGAFKRKLKKEKDKFEAKLPKLTEYFELSQSDIDRKNDLKSSECMQQSETTHESTQLDAAVNEF